MCSESKPNTHHVLQKQDVFKMCLSVRVRRVCTGNTHFSFPSALETKTHLCVCACVNKQWWGYSSRRLCYYLPLDTANASISSKKMIDGATALAFRNTYANTHTQTHYFHLLTLIRSKAQQHRKWVSVSLNRDVWPLWRIARIHQHIYSVTLDPEKHNITTLMLHHSYKKNKAVRFVSLSSCLFKTLN